LEIGALVVRLAKPVVAEDVARHNERYLEQSTQRRQCRMLESMFTVIETPTFVRFASDCWNDEETPN
jgi:hypothetical protein